MKTVLAAVDESRAGRPVMAMAVALAPVLGAAVQAVHVAENGGDAARAAADALQLPFETISGDPVEELAALAERDDVVAVVIGARGLPNSPRPAGHLTLALADRTEKPVMVVPPDTRAPERLRTVLVAMEGTAAQVHSLKRAIDIAEGAGLELVVVHVHDQNLIPMFSDQIQHETDAYARGFLARYCPGAPSARFELRVGVPADEILATADSVGAELVAVGWPCSAPGRGVVVREIIDRSQIPLLLVPID